MEIKKLLFVTKFEELWYDALNSLLDLKKTSLNHVVLLNVIERDNVALHRGTGYRKKEEIKLREKANIRFIDWAENLFEQGLEVGAYIVVGSLVSQVITAAEKEAVDLIVIGRSKKGKLEQLFSGSDITEIIRRSSKPVLVYKHISPDATAKEHLFSRPLIAMDWSPASLRAIKLMRELKGIISEVNVIHVADEKDLNGDSAMGAQKTRKEARRRLEDVCAALEADGIQVRTHVYIGDTVAEIEKAGRECQASMIVAGTSAKGVWIERWIGSTPQSLAEDGDFPVLLIPPLAKT